jgi:hypothetical protein
MVIDPSGNVFVTGYTQSTIFPTQTASINHGVDVYAAKLNADGSNFDYILWFNALTYFAEDYGYGIDIDNTGSVYITGITNSDDFCAISGTVPGYNQIYGGSGDAFVLKINPNGTMVYCSFLGGGEWDAGQAIVVDAAGNAYITGSTYSPEFPTTPAAYNTNHAGLTDVFVAKLDSTGTQLLYSTFIGADEREDGRAIALDESNHIYVTGWTRSTNFPTTLGTALEIDFGRAGHKTLGVYYFRRGYRVRPGSICRLPEAPQTGKRAQTSFASAPSLAVSGRASPPSAVV